MPFKNLLNISDLTRKDMDQILDHAGKLGETSSDDLKNKNIGLIFEKYSTRTRLSFQVGISQLNGNPIDIKFEELNLQRTESFEDTFKIFGCYLDAIIFRTTSHIRLIEASKAFQKPIINALSDLSHPCQIISDLFTLKNHFSTLNNITISWLGDVNNVLYSFIEAAKIFPEISLNIFTDKKIHQENILKFPQSDNVNFYYDVIGEEIKNSDCIMTDVFTSMNDKSHEKEIMLKKYQVNRELMSLTKDSCIFMHCLPANIGSEVTDEVLNSSQSIVMKQAKNRLISQKGILKWLNI
jgi:ornithine carbamoyltransferase